MFRFSKIQFLRFEIRKFDSKGLLPFDRSDPMFVTLQ